MNKELDVDVTYDIDEDDNSIRVIVKLSGFNEETEEDAPMEWFAEHLADYIEDKMKELGEKIK